MSIDTARVIWSEGLFLRPHHFQQQERYLESLIEARLGPLMSAGYGFLRLSIDNALLLQGKFALESAEGIMQDGTPFEVPSDTTRLSPMDVPEGARDQIVYLSAMLRRSGSKTVALERADRRTRFEGIDAKIGDTVMGFDSEAELKVGVLSLSLGLAETLDGALTSMPVARIVERRADGSVVLDSRFIPPLVDVGANRRMRSWVDELHGLVKQRAEALAARIGAPGTKGVADFADFLLLLVCNRYEPLLQHFRRTSPLHPMALYAELLKLAGECAAFGQESRRPPEFPSYKHVAIADCFEPVIEEIRRAMVAILEQTAVQIPLRSLGKGLYGADIPDPQLIRSGFFVLAASAQMDKESLRSTLPTQIKIGPPEKIRDLVMTMVPGVRIEPMEAPRQIPFHANCCYFQLDGRSEFWQPIEVSRRLALHVAGDLPALELQLWAIRT